MSLVSSLVTPQTTATTTKENDRPPTKKNNKKKLTRQQKATRARKLKKQKTVGNVVPKTIDTNKVPGFIPLNLRTTPMVFEQLRDVAMPPPDANGRVPYTTNNLVLAENNGGSGRNCVVEAMTFASGDNLTNLGLLKKDLNKLRVGPRFAALANGTSIGLIAEALARAKSALSLRRRSDLSGGTWLAILLIMGEGMFLLNCITRPFNDHRRDRHIVVYDSYRRLLVIKPDADYPYSVRVTPDDLASSEAKIQKYLEEEYGLVTPTEVHQLLVLKNRITDTNYVQ